MSQYRSRIIGAVSLLTLAILGISLLSSEKLDVTTTSTLLESNLRGGRRLDPSTWLPQIPPEDLERYPTITSRLYFGIANVGQVVPGTDAFDKRLKDKVLAKVQERSLLPPNPYLDAVSKRANAMGGLAARGIEVGSAKFNNIVARREQLSNEKYENKFLKDIIGDFYESDPEAGTAEDFALLHRPHPNQRVP